DLTAYSITSKFEYNPPTIPDFNKERKNKKLINNFSLKEFKANSINSLNLNYELWNEIAKLDSIEYFKFIYPENGLYLHSFKSPDSITQFSPFVFIDGEMQAVQVIYVDNVPVYFSWATNVQPYSFRIHPGYRKIKLRTLNQVIQLDHVFFKEAEKTIISIDAEKPNYKVNIQTAKPLLKKAERKFLEKYVLPYKYNFGDRLTYLITNDNIIFLEPENKSWRTNYEIQYCGPVNGFMEYVSISNYSHKFNHEPFFEYEFGKNFIKMINAERKRYPMHFNDKKQTPNLHEYVLTEKRISDLWKEQLESRRYTSTRVTYPQKTEKGCGSLHFDVHNNKNDIAIFPINSILLSYDNPTFIRVYPGNYRAMHQLEQGKYSLILVYSDSKYFMVEDIEINKNGKTFIKINNPELLTHENFTKRVSEILNKSVLDDYKSWINNERHNVTSIQNIYREEFSYYGPGNKVQGYVYDSMDESPIPGASIVIKGTTIGALTDLNGFYSINVPSGNNTLIFAFVGCKTEEVDVDYKSRIDVNLEPDICALEEVVVVGYGTQRRRSLTGSVSNVEYDEFSGQLQGMAAGVVMSGAPGVNSQMQIRGTSSMDSSDSPLIIIDGVVFTGDLSSLSPDFIDQIQVLDGTTAVGLYGSRAHGGAVIISSKSGSSYIDQSTSDKDDEFDEMFLEAMSDANTLRTNFSDYAFWQPKLTTNKDGLASFEATFPDDITSWKTFYLAMNGKKQSGQTRGTIRSYKPVMAQLSLPKFLIQTDTAFAIGKVVNYMNDSIEVKSNLYINDENVFSTERYCSNSIVDSLKLIAQNDSIKVKYTLETENGYFDGEQRSVEVYPIGLEETLGEFFIMSKDTIIGIDFVENAGKA
ncbi:MAG: carboxypeptidase-like regulatory domain-containing protein, partial [bacterium]